MMRKNGKSLAINWLLNSEIEILSDEEIDIDSIEELDEKVAYTALDRYFCNRGTVRSEERSPRTKRDNLCTNATK